jgi:hypothetical protein
MLGADVLHVLDGLQSPENRWSCDRASPDVMPM